MARREENSRPLSLQYAAAYNNSPNWLTKELQQLIPSIEPSDATDTSGAAPGLRTGGLRR